MKERRDVETCDDVDTFFLGGKSPCFLSTDHGGPSEVVMERVGEDIEIPSCVVLSLGSLESWISPCPCVIR
jgi:hypothetical protein